MLQASHDPLLHANSECAAWLRRITHSSKPACILQATSCIICELPHRQVVSEAAAETNVCCFLPTHMLQLLPRKKWSSIPMPPGNGKLEDMCVDETTTLGNATLVRIGLIL